MFSQTAEYALRAIVYIAACGDVPATIHELAARTRCPEGYLAKVVKLLGRAGLVRARRGPHGGSVLGRPPEQISIHDVLQAVDPIQRIRACPLALGEHGTKLCRLHGQLDRTLELLEQSLKQTRVSDLITDGSVLPLPGPLCGVAPTLKPNPSTPLRVGTRRRKPSR